MTDTIPNLLLHLKILIEDAGLQITLKPGEGKLEAILNSKVKNLEQFLGQSLVVPGSDEDKSYTTIYSKYASFSRCINCNGSCGTKRNSTELAKDADISKLDICNDHNERKTTEALEEITNCSEIHWNGMREKFTEICLGILTRLKELITGIKNDINTLGNNKNQGKSPRDLVLGIRDQKLIAATLQFVVSLGICPNLYPGVGIPLHQRTGFSKILKELDTEQSKDEIFLFFCIKHLCNISQNDEIGTLIFTKMLGDIIAALIQIGYQKSKTEEQRKIAQEQKEDPANEDFNITNSKLVESATKKINVIPVCPHEREWCRNELNNILNRIYQPLVIRELLMLQGSGRKNKTSQKTLTSNANSPKWLRKICGKLLSQKLMQKNGVRFVLSAILEGSSMDAQIAHAKCDMIGRLVSNCPMIAKSVDEYYKTISPQILELLEMKSTEEMTRNVYVCALSNCITWMALKNISLTKELMIKPLIHPFHLATADDIAPPVADSLSDEIANEEKINRSVELIHKVFIVGMNPRAHMVEMLSEYAQPLFELYCFLREKLSHLKTLLKEILLWLMHNNVSSKNQNMLLCFLFGNIMPDIKMHCWRVMSERLTYSNGPSGGAVLVKIPRNDDQQMDNIVSTEARIVGLLDLLVAMKSRDEIGLFFICLLKKLLVISEGQKETMSGSEKYLGHINENITTLKFKIPLVSMLAAMCDKLGNCVLNDPKQSLKFVKLTLECCCLETAETRQPGIISEDEIQQETLCMALGILSLIITDADEMLQKDFTEIQEFLPVLKKISEQNCSTYIQHICDDLHICIATHGAIIDDAIYNKSIKKDDYIDLRSEKAFDAAITELTDPLIPTRGHSLLQLSRLIEARNPKALGNADKLLNIFMTNLCHDDTYIYLAAIQGLVSLSEFKHEVVIPHLAREFAMFGNEFEKEAKAKGKCLQENGNHTKKTRHSSEMRLKIGEALVKATRQCGSLLPMYSQLLLSSLLTGVKDDDADVRASSLSNIADVCKLLRYSIGSIIHEIMTCISTVLRSDVDCKVREAALLVVTMLLEGLGQDAIEAIGSILKDLYRLLKITAASEKSERVKWHAERALGELESVMKKYLFPEQIIQKKIQVLHSS